MLRRSLTIALAGALILSLQVIATDSAHAGNSDYRDPVDITFPLAADATYNGGSYHYINDYDQSRSRGYHGATDIMTDHGTKVHAVVGGEITVMTGAGDCNGSWTGTRDNPPSWGYAMYIDGDDGRSYVYIHLGRDGQPATTAYAPESEMAWECGERVERGQHIAYAGSSGNASESGPHLHLQIHDDAVKGSTPDGSDRVNPYFSLQEAEQRNDFPGGAPAAAQPEPEPDKYRESFRDIEGTTHADAIADAFHEGLVSGCRSEYYCPEDSVQRQQMASFIVRAAERMSPRDGEAPFDDVTAGSSHGPTIAELHHRGVVQGIERDGARLYRPLEDVTRGQMATFLVESIEGLEPRNGDSDFADVDADNPHAESINALVDAGIANGYTDDDGTQRFKPTEPVHRGQMATFLGNARDAGL